MSRQTYRSIYGDNEVRTIIPPRSTAQTLFDAFQAAQGAQEEVARIEKTIPNYTGQWSNEDYTGDARNELNRAIDAFEDAVVASVQERTKPDTYTHATSGN